eukprot:7022827-Pyramimonas_sp.AAC.1
MPHAHSGKLSFAAACGAVCHALHQVHVLSTVKKLWFRTTLTLLLQWRPSPSRTLSGSRVPLTRARCPCRARRS